MCMTKDEIYAYCVELSVRNNDIFDIPVVINNRLTRTLGRVTYSIRGINRYCENKQLEISGQLLKSSTKEDIIQVIKHEWAHYYIIKTTHAEHGHDSLFQQVCEKINCAHDKPTNQVERVVPPEQLYKYTIYCANCGCLGGQSRMSKTLQSLKYGLIKCKKCGGHNLIYKQNW